MRERLTRNGSLPSHAKRNEPNRLPRITLEGWDNAISWARRYTIAMPVRWTNRLAELRTQDWESESSEEALEQISEHGATNIHVLGDEHSMSWTYSTGMYDT